MDLIIFLVIGGVIGWLGSILMKADSQMGLLGNIIVGIIGSGLGHWLAPKLGIASGNVMQWVIAIGGAVLLIFLLKVLGVFK